MDECKTLARRTLYWPNVMRHREPSRQMFRVQQLSQPASSRTLLSHPVPDRPWQNLGVDIFLFKEKDYLLVIDYYSKYPEISRLPDKTASTVITYLKEIFARHGIPEQLFSDKMPFNSRKVYEFADDWKINLTTSSPRYA